MLCMSFLLFWRKGNGAEGIGRNCRFSRVERKCCGSGYGGLIMYALFYTKILIYISAQVRC